MSDGCTCGGVWIVATWFPGEFLECPESINFTFALQRFFILVGAVACEINFIYGRMCGHWRVKMSTKTDVIDHWHQRKADATGEKYFHFKGFLRVSPENFDLPQHGKLSNKVQSSVLIDSCVF